jgi:hypothetical protein
MMQNAKISAIEIVPVTTPSTCAPVTVDFDTTANGVSLQGGKYVSKQWESLGLTLSAVGGLEGEDRPRIFDTSYVGNDPDLGAPNEFCTNPGPGKGDGGEPGQIGENCVPQGNALIVQTADETITIPDDNVDGGSIAMDFSKDVSYVSEIGLLDIDYDALLIITYHDGGVDVIDVPVLGDNSFQKIAINKWNVKRMVLDLTRSGAITFISFCHGNAPPTSIPTNSPPTMRLPTREPPTPNPPTPPTEVPPTPAPPTPAPPTKDPPTLEACTEVEVDFSSVNCSTLSPGSGQQCSTGQCPQGEVCDDDPSTFSCTCRQLNGCDSANSTQCATEDSSCPPGKLCRRDGEVCSCQDLCGGEALGTCGNGECPTGQVCDDDPSSLSCTCRQLSTETISTSTDITQSGTTTSGGGTTTTTEPVSTATDTTEGGTTTSEAGTTTTTTMTTTEAVPTVAPSMTVSPSPSPDSTVSPSPSPDSTLFPSPSADSTVSPSSSPDSTSDMTTTTTTTTTSTCATTCAEPDCKDCNYELLTWADFQGPDLPANAAEDAYIFTGPVLNWNSHVSVQEKDANCQLTGDWICCIKEIDSCAIVDKSQSATKGAQFETNALLQHEQYHYYRAKKERNSSYARPI